MPSIASHLVRSSAHTSIRSIQIEISWSLGSTLRSTLIKSRTFHLQLRTPRSSLHLGPHYPPPQSQFQTLSSTATHYTPPILPFLLYVLHRLHISDCKATLNPRPYRHPALLLASLLTDPITTLSHSSLPGRLTNSFPHPQQSILSCYSSSATTTLNLSKVMAAPEPALQA